MFKKKLILAPMEDVTDTAFRLTCKHYGADIVVTPMVHTRSAIRGKGIPKTLAKERPLGAQIAGENISELIETAKIMQKKADFIDVNFGCPGWNVIRSGYGSALLKEPQKITAILSSLNEQVRIPITAKIRSGYEKPNTLRIARAVEKGGADAITVHPRTVRQGYSGKADWQAIQRVKKELSIPVIGNGDVRTGKDAERMLEIADSVMIGRAAIGNPAIFRSIKHYLDTGEEIQQDRAEAFEMYINNARRLGQLDKTRIMRQAQNFTKGSRGASKLRDELSKADTETIIKKTTEYLNTKL